MKLTAYQRAEKWGQLHFQLQSATDLAYQQEHYFTIRERVAKALEILTELENGTAVPIEIKLPRCWAELATVQFNELQINDPGMGPILDATLRTTDNDILPYYDDERVRNGRNAEGWVVEVNLLSGQHNYWCDVNIYAPNGEHIIEAGMLESIEDVNNFESDAGRKFKITVIWE